MGVFNLKTAKRKETIEQRFIRILSVLDRAEWSVSTDENTSNEDLLALEELLAAGFIMAYEHIRDGQAEVRYMNGIRFTLRGRAYFAMLKKQHRGFGRLFHRDGK